MTVAKHGVSTNTPDRLVVGPGAVYIGFYDVDSPGTLLGATKGGNTFELTRDIRDIRPDGAKGKVKGFRRIESVEAVLKVNLLEVTAENLRRALAVDSYSSGTTDITDEAVGNGNGVLTEFALDHGNVVENSETVTVNAVTQTRGTDYTVDYDTGELQFFSPVTDTHAIVASYKYISGDAVLISEEVPDNAYCSTVALVIEHTGFTPSTDPLIIKLTNALVDAGLNLNLAAGEELVTALTFSGHYSNSDLETEPWSIIYPST